MHDCGVIGCYGGISFEVSIDIPQAITNNNWFWRGQSLERGYSRPFEVPLPPDALVAQQQPLDRWGDGGGMFCALLDGLIFKYRFDAWSPQAMSQIGFTALIIWLSWIWRAINFQVWQKSLRSMLGTDISLAKPQDLCRFIKLQKAPLKSSTRKKSDCHIADKNESSLEIREEAMALHDDECHIFRDRHNLF